MAEPLAAVIFREDEVPERALSFGFALATAGCAVPDPRLLCAPLRQLPGWTAAFYRSGARRVGPDAFTEDDENEHARELFEEELPPGLLVQRATRELAAERGGEPGSSAARAATAMGELRPPKPPAARESSFGASLRSPIVYAIALAEMPLCDDAWRFDERGVTRAFLRDGDDGLEAGVETPDGAEITPLELDVAEDASDAEERAAVAELARLHGGASFLTRELGAPVVGALVGALYEADRPVAVRLVEADPASIDRETRALVSVLRRHVGRGSFTAPDVAGVAPPAAYRAFALAYDWADPSDPPDLYRDLALGAVEGSLRFLRLADLASRATEPEWRAAAAAGYFPLAALRSGPLGGGGTERTLALGADGAELAIVRGGSRSPAGPTLGELLRYLSLGWSTRSAAQELVIGALMLRARIRAGEPR